MRTKRFIRLFCPLAGSCSCMLLSHVLSCKTTIVGEEALLPLLPTIPLVQASASRSREACMFVLISWREAVAALPV